MFQLTYIVDTVKCLLIHRQSDNGDTWSINMNYMGTSQRQANSLLYVLHQFYLLINPWTSLINTLHKWPDWYIYVSLYIQPLALPQPGESCHLPLEVIQLSFNTVFCSCANEFRIITVFTICCTYLPQLKGSLVKWVRMFHGTHVTTSEAGQNKASDRQTAQFWTHYCFLKTLVTWASVV